MPDPIPSLAEIRARVDGYQPKDLVVIASQDVPALLAAVEGVLAVHVPTDALMNPGRHERVVKVCTGCGQDDGNWQHYPCPTVRAIAAHVRIEEEVDRG